LFSREAEALRSRARSCGAERARLRILVSNYRPSPSFGLSPCFGGCDGFFGGGVALGGAAGFVGAGDFGCVTLDGGACGATRCVGNVVRGAFTTGGREIRLAFVIGGLSDFEGGLSDFDGGLSDFGGAFGGALGGAGGGVLGCDFGGC
jgi:hypothetical protein